MSEVLQNRLILINTLQATGDSAGAGSMRSPALHDTQGVKLHAQPLGLPEEIDQHKGAPLAVILQVLSLKAPQRPAGDLNCVTGSKHALKESLRGLPEQVNQLRRHLGWLVSKAHKLTHPQGRSNRRPVLDGVVQAYKEVAAEHGLFNRFYTLISEPFNLNHRQKTLKSLVLKILQGTGLLSGFGMNHIPSGVIYLSHRHLRLIKSTQNPNTF